MKKSETPGLKWRRRNGQRLAYWVCRADPRLKAFRPRTQLLWRGPEAEAAPLPEIGEHCKRLQQEMFDFLWGPVRRTPGRPKPPTGSIYFVACADAVKIGYTKNVAKRLQQIQLGNPLVVELVTTLEGNPTTERQLHRRFRALHIRGEWYRRAGAVESFINSVIGTKAA